MKEESNSILDFIKSLLDRIVNPPIFSFLCSWLVCNWRVTIAVLWHDTSQLGGKSIFEFIAINTNCINSFWLPFIFAVAYTLGIPFIKTWVREYTFTINHKSQGVISEIAATEQTNEDREFVRLLYNSSLIHGNWYRQIGAEEKVLMSFDDRRINRVYEHGNAKHVQNMVDFQYDSRNGKIFFVATDLSNDNPHIYHLSFIGTGFNILRGNINYKTEVEFTRA
jgi:hypothetical protein